MALAHGVVVAHAALRVDPAGAGARVRALGVDAGLVRGTVVVETALRTTADGRVTLVVLDTGTHGSVPLHLALGVGTTGGGVAGILNYILDYYLIIMININIWLSLLTECGSIKYCNRIKEPSFRQYCMAETPKPQNAEI